jgi:hypothetical protein
MIDREHGSRRQQSSASFSSQRRVRAQVAAASSVQMRNAMKTEPELQKIEAVRLDDVQGGARGGRPINPIDPFGVWDYWMNFTPQFSTTPFFPRPFG